MRERRREGVKERWRMRKEKGGRKGERRKRESDKVTCILISQ